jgi:hypothetical protein
MNDTPTIDLDDPMLREADVRAVMETLVTGKSVCHEIAARVRARADKIVERLRETHGDTAPTADLIREVRDE